MNERTKSQVPKKDIMYTLEDDNSRYIINESYYYKTVPYYTIVKNEYEGVKTVPSSSDVLDAYIVPICLEKAKLAGIPICDWVISYQYISLPAVIYGLNYFSTPSEHFVAMSVEEAKKVIKHVTNHGKYPFCYQKVADASAIVKCVSIFGKTINCCEGVSNLADKIYKAFCIPLVEIVLVKDAAGYRLSSLAPVKYSQLSKEETELLQNLLDTRVNRSE